MLQWCTCLPIERICIVELPKVKRASLTDEPDTTCTCRAVVKADEQHVREVEAAEFYVQHVGCGLDLGLETMRRTPKHHHCAGQL
jgi:hypothetical protein